MKQDEHDATKASQVESKQASNLKTQQLDEQSFIFPVPLGASNLSLSLKSLADIAKLAGDEIMTHYKGEAELNIQHKSDASPVTAADLASHYLIVKALEELTPNIPIMSEEAADIDWSTRQTWSTYWLIDPLDGTKEFINQNDEFTVNIALIYKGKPIVGVVHAPALAKCYFGAVGLGAWLELGHNELRSGESGNLVPLQAKANVSRSVPIVVGSRSHPSPDLAQYLKTMEDYQLLSVGSSLKFCMLAEGLADVYPRLGLTSEWDTAAAQAVLESAGGKVINYQDALPLRYNQKSSLLNPYFIATSADYELGELALSQDR